MRAKMRIAQVERHSETCETLHFSAVCKSDGYPEDGSDENNSFARWTPTASLSMSVTNPALIGQFAEGEEYYLDFSRASAAA
jgi:hypothetical protein